ncbi:glutamate receptor ionotropic, kainate glr-3-like, partial [Patella vulgata]|uniref:glutamate receptor ionotropic, kainate glr-3-like n=1 Tax=Patella vulgata TaxID=6465 RepID=UPI0024A9FA9E
FPNTKYGFNNRNFNVATNTWAPFTLIEPTDGQWGVVANGSWTGLVGQVLRREVDLVVAPLVITSERLKVMDFSFPFFHDYSAVLFKMPDPNRSKWRKLAEPFKWQVFVCIIASFLLLTFLLYTLERCNPFYVTQNKKRYSFLDMILYVYGAMLIQGGPNQPKSSSGRFLVAFWWLFSIIVAATYSGNLIAFLTVAKDKPPFETLDELGSQNTYRWGTLGGTSSKGKEVQQLWEGVSEFIKSDPDVLSESTAVHMEKVETGNYAYIADKGMLEIEMAKKCDWVFLKELFFPLQYGVGLPKDSPFYNLFYDEMLRIYETGLLQIWKQRWWPKQGTCKGSLISEVRKIELIDIQSAFYVIALGIAIASTIILGEIIYTRQKKKSE